MKTLIDLYKIENEKGFYDVKVNGFPLWYIFRHTYRNKWTGQDELIKNISNSTWKNLSGAISHSFKSLIDLLIILFGNAKKENAFFPISRLQKVNGQYLDKFTDPIIDQTNLSKSYCIFQFSFRTDYNKTRQHRENTFSTEFALGLFRIFSLLFYYPHKLTNSSRKINELFDRAKGVLDLTDNDRKAWHEEFIFHDCQREMWQFIFKKLRIRRIFFVIRSMNYPQIVAAHALGIPIYELQHGITFGESELYGGKFENCANPDKFLSFGDLWIGNQFGIEIEKIINIGWAYKSYISKFLQTKQKENAILIVSSPEISIAIVKTAIELANNYVDFLFEIRCHPEESLSEEILNKIDIVSNLLVADNKVDSNLALSQYKYILGTNSTVIYEALGQGKKVGRLCFNGLTCNRIKDVEDDGFFYLNSLEDFNLFINSNSNTLAKQGYSDFNPESVENLTKKEW